MKFLTLFLMLLQSPIILADAFSDRLISFAIIDASSARFVETWNADYLDEPLISKGTLKYIRPSQLTKLITSPERIEQRIEGDQLSIEHSNKTHLIQLSEQPELAVSIYALQAMLNGDKDRLNRLFELQYSELKANWILTLMPKDKHVADSLESIVLQGNGARILRIYIQFYNDDSLLTEITHE